METRQTTAAWLCSTALIGVCLMQQALAHQANYTVYLDPACVGTNMIAHTYSDVLASWHFGYRGFMIPNEGLVCHAIPAPSP